MTSIGKEKLQVWKVSMTGWSEDEKLRMRRESDGQREREKERNWWMEKERKDG